MTHLLHSRAFLLLAGALVVWGACMLSWAAGQAAVWAPQSLASMLPGLFVFGLVAGMAPNLPVYMLVLPVLFAAWHLVFTRRDGKVGMISLLVTAELILLCIYYVYRLHGAAVEAHGPLHAYAMILFNLLFLVALFFAYRRNQDAPTPLNGAAFHALLFAWLGWVAFPWPGGSWFP